MDSAVGTFIERYQGLGLKGTPATIEEIERLERQLGMEFPAAYKAFLLILGRDGGPDFVGSDCTIRTLPSLRMSAEQMLRSAGSQFVLPDKAVVFLMHQGYYFAFFVTDGRADDPPSLRISGGRASSATEGYLILDLA